MGKTKQQDNPFIEPSQQHTVVDMKGETARARARFLKLEFPVRAIDDWAVCSLPFRIKTHLVVVVVVVSQT